MINIHYSQIRECDVSNGEGIGVALFVQGCRFGCYNCFNPETWDFNGGKEWTSEVREKFLELIDRPYIKRVSLLGGECLADENLDGVLDLVTEINKRYNTPQDIVYDKEQKHNMLSVNTDKIRLSFPNKSIWIYSGYSWDQLIEEYNQYKYTPFNIDADKWLTRYEIISKCDVMVDGRYIDSQRNPSKKWAGSDNQRVINVSESLKQNKVILYCD